MCERLEFYNRVSMIMRRMLEFPQQRIRNVNATAAKCEHRQHIAA